MKQAGLIAVLALVPALLAAYLHPKVPAWSREAAGVPEVTAAQIVRWGESVLFVDARGESAYRLRHIPGAISLNEDRWNELGAAFFEKWHPDHRVVVYCDRRCNSSHEVARRLRRELDQENVYVLKGGWEAWNEAQNP